MRGEPFDGWLQRFALAGAVGNHRSLSHPHATQPNPTPTHTQLQHLEDLQGHQGPQVCSGAQEAGHGADGGDAAKVRGGRRGNGEGCNPPNYLHVSTTTTHNLPHNIHNPLTRGTWREEDFKAYNFEALGLPTAGGALHPLLKVRILCVWCGWRGDCCFWF
jgi:hypothetical protein